MELNICRIFISRDNKRLGGQDKMKIYSTQNGYNAKYKKPKFQLGMIFYFIFSRSPCIELRAPEKFHIYIRYYVAQEIETGSKILITDVHIELNILM